MLRRDTPHTASFRELQAVLDNYSDYIEQRYHAALWYIKSGIHILPFRQGEKAGYPKGITLQAKYSASTVKTWWHPETGIFLDYDICMPMGGRSGLCAIDLDVDAAEGKDGINTLAELLQSVGGWSGEDPEIETWIQETPRGGRHLVYKFHPEIGAQAGERFEDIDTRGGNKDDPSQNAGVIFAAPTIKKDEDGATVGSYQWQLDCTELSDVPHWLVDCLKGRISQRIQLPDSFVSGSRDSEIHKYLMSCAGAGYTEDELKACVPHILERMIPPDKKLVDKCLRSVLASRVFASAKKEKIDKDLIGGLQLDRTQKGQVIKSEKNLHTILKSAFFELEMGIFYDAFLRELTYNNALNSYGVDVAVPVKEWISRMFGVEWGSDTILAALVYVCKSLKEHTNVLKDYVYNCSHEQSFSAVHWLGNLLGFEGHEREKVYRRYLKLWLTGAVARALHPGTKFDYMLILIGSQGIGKSMLLNELVPDAAWFCDSLTAEVAAGTNKKDELLKLQGAWIIEMAEMTPFKNRRGQASDAELKGFLTATKDKYRAPYERLPADHSRTCVFAGTSNTHDLFRDVTGNRRYLTIDIGNHTIDWPLIKGLRDNIWAEVREYYIKEGNQALWLDQEEREVQNEINRESYSATPLGDAIIEWCKSRTRIEISDIIWAMERSPLSKGENAHAIGREAIERLKFEGFEKKLATYVDSKGAKLKRRVWCNPKHPYEQMSVAQRRKQVLHRFGESEPGAQY